MRRPPPRVQRVLAWTAAVVVMTVSLALLQGQADTNRRQNRVLSQIVTQITADADAADRGRCEAGNDTRAAIATQNDVLAFLVSLVSSLPRPSSESGRAILDTFVAKMNVALAQARDPLVERNCDDNSIVGPSKSLIPADPSTPTSSG